jgi:hypothetical protein
MEWATFWATFSQTHLVTLLDYPIQTTPALNLPCFARESVNF